MNFRYLTEYIDRLYETEGIPSSDMVVYQHGQPIYRHSAGFQDVETREPLRRDALYFMYSATKLLTVTAGMQLLEKGKFLLNDPVSDYLPEFTSMKVKEKDEAGNITLVRAEPMLVRDLFCMTSGLDYAARSPEIMACVAEHDGEPTTADIVRAIATRPLSFQPGTHWAYSLSHDVLLRLVEAVADQTFADYAKANIFDPIGMESTFMHYDESLAPRMAAQYRFNGMLGRAVDVGLTNEYVFGSKHASGGAGAISCTDDYIRFAEMLTHMGLAPNSNRILAESTVELMRRDCLNESSRPDFNWPRMRGYSYGFGVRVLQDPALSGTLSSVGEFGWGGAAGAYVHCDPAKELTIVYLQHMLNNKEDIVHPRLRNLVYAALEY